MTDREKAIVMAYTGKAMLTGEKFSIFHKYIEDILGRSVWTHELADRSVWEEIEEKSKSDFLELCKNEGRPQGDLISRSALKEKLTPIKLYGGVYCKAITEKDIDDAPTIEPEELKRVRNICEHWNDKSSSFVSACNAFEDILHIFKMGVGDMNCGAAMHKPNCVRCDHFGDCDGCERSGEE